MSNENESDKFGGNYDPNLAKKIRNTFKDRVVPPKEEKEKESE